jgi:hypothetical protein
MILLLFSLLKYFPLIFFVRCLILLVWLQYWLFDLENDPYETNNLYYSENSEHTSAKDKLYTLLPGYMERAKTKISIHWSLRAKVYWQEEGNNILPWANPNALLNDGDYPSYSKSCGF